jgi:hypothetical protein
MMFLDCFWWIYLPHGNTTPISAQVVDWYYVVVRREVTKPEIFSGHVAGIRVIRADSCCLPMSTYTRLQILSPSRSKLHCCIRRFGSRYSPLDPLFTARYQL